MIDTRPPYEEVPALKRFSMHARHGFFGRVGGVSTGVYKSLNCGPGSGDDPAKVLENRRRVCHALGAPPEKLASPRQIHPQKPSSRTRRSIPTTAPNATHSSPNVPAFSSACSRPTARRS